MATELQKYRAQYLQIAGFCLMTPFGKVILGLIDYDLGKMWLKLLLYFVLALFLFFIGTIFIFKGEEHIEKRRYR